jgi:hypothetical protein
MELGFLTADRKEYKKPVTKRGKIAQKYKNQKEMIKSKLQS